MKQKLIAAGLAVTLLFGGATFSSATVSPMPIGESKIDLSDIKNDDSMQPMIWGQVAKYVGQGALLGVAWVLGEKAIGNNITPSTEYEFEEISESFDY